MQTRVALISMIVEEQDAALEINALLHSYRQYIIGRMGLPYAAKQISIISIAMDAPQDDHQRAFRQARRAARGQCQNGIF